MASADSRRRQGGSVRDFWRPARHVLTAALALAVVAGCKDSTGNTTVESIRFAGLPTSVVAGQTFSIDVELLNPSGEIADGSRASVTIRLVGSGTLNGETTLNASAGVARFEGLQLTVAATTLILEAQVGMGTDAIIGQSSSFAVTAATVNAQQSTAEAPETPLFPFGPNPMTFTFKDEFGNAIGNAQVSVTASLAGSRFNPSQGTTNGAGRFETAFDPGGVGNVMFSATVGGTSFTFPTSFAAVDQCPPAAMTVGAQVNGTVPAGACRAEGRPASSFGFSMAAQGGISFTLTSPFLPLFEVQTEPPGVNARVIEPNTWEWLLPGGTYRFRVASLAEPGAFSFNSMLTAGNSDGVARVLVRPGVYGGQSITAGDFVLFDDGTFVDYYYILSRTPCTISMAAVGFDPWLAVAHPSLDPAIEDWSVVDDDPDGDDIARITLSHGCSTPAGSPIIIIANNFLAAARGPYTLTVTFQGGSAPAQVRANATQTIPFAYEPFVVPARTVTGNLLLNKRRSR